MKNKTLLNIPSGQKSLHEPATRSENKKPRGWQKTAYNMLKGQPYSLIEGPTGSGKSVAAKMLLIYKVNRNPRAKSIVVVPQRAIVDAWGPCHIQGVGHWKPRLLTSERCQNVSREITQWAKETNGAVVCTHMGLIKAWPKIRDILAHEQTTLWIDEAHHLEYLYDDEELKSFVNATGNILQEALAKGMEVGVSSATLFRGDKSLILNPELRRLFKSYRMEFEDYISSMEYIQDIRYMMETYRKSPLEGLAKLREKKAKGTILYIPSPNSKESKAWKDGKKHAQVQEIMRLLGSAQEEDGISHTKCGHRVVNLVRNSSLKEKEDVIRDGKTDIVISLRRFLEGANWLEAHTAYIIGRRHNIIQLIQILGRLLRDHPSKTCVKMVQLFPTPKTTSPREVKNRVEDYLHTLCGALLLKELLQPKHTILQKYGSETTIKILQAATTAFKNTKKSEKPAETASRIHGEIMSAAQRCQPNIPPEDLKKLADTAEELVLQELEAQTKDDALENGNHTSRPESCLHAKTLRLKITSRVDRIGKARKNLRIISANLAGTILQDFQDAVEEKTTDKLEQIALFARDHNIRSLAEWKTWAEENLQKSGSAKEDESTENPESLPGWDSWETIMDKNLPSKTWEGNFQAMQEDSLICSILTKKQMLVERGSQRTIALMRWINRQRRALDKNSPKVSKLQIWMAKNSIPSIPPIIPANRSKEAKLWADELGSSALEVNPKELKAFFKKRGVNIPMSTPKPFVDATIPVETYWLNTQQIPVKRGSILALAQEATETPNENGYMRFMQAVVAERIRQEEQTHKTRWN
jgi:superfamily II DNA or RNA helicase